MPAYKCVKQGCGGVVTFDAKPDEKGAADPSRRGQQRRHAVIVIVEDEPVPCPVCGTSYYERELRQS